MTWGNIKKGDTVIRLQRYARHGDRPQQYADTVLSVGPRWITTTRGKFTASTGQSERWQLHTTETLAAYERARATYVSRHALCDRIRRALNGEHTVETLEAVMKLLNEAPK